MSRIKFWIVESDGQPDSTFREPESALVEFGRRWAQAEARTGEKLTCEDMGWLSRRDVARMDDSSYPITAAVKVDPRWDKRAGARVWLHVRTQFNYSS
jgi:hypothetical protein